MGAKCKLPSGGAGLAAEHEPKSAYDFIFEGLNFAVERVHGPLTPAQALVAQYMVHEDIDLHEVMDRREEGRLDPDVSKAIEEAGGFEKLNRHVGGPELCWGLRDYALLRWGLLASTVLRTWGITQTRDFGNLVFALIESGCLQKEPHDCHTDFEEVFDFKEALDEAFRVEFED
ncbi:MAG: Minf_1886 family protein [Planctomycetota bacterium]